MVVCGGVLVWRAVRDFRVVRDLEDDGARVISARGDVVCEDSCWLVVESSVMDGVVSEFVVFVTVSLRV